MGVAPLVVAHRGASGIRPEHTREAFEQAIDLGADVLEVDVVATADGVLVARHDWALSRTTDVAQRRELAGWRTTRSGRDGPVTDWWVDRMTLEQVRSLRARERWPALRRSSATYDGQCPLMTLREVLDLAVQESDRRARRVGVAVELKDVGPAAAQHGVDLVELLLDDLAAAGLPRPQVPVWVMAFEPRPLERLSAMVSPTSQPLHLVRLVEHRTPATDRGWDELARGADTVGVALDLLLATAGAANADDVVHQCASRGLGLWTWTFRAENSFLPATLRVGHDPGAYGAVQVQVAEALRCGVEGLVGDHPDVLRGVLSVMS